MKKVKVYERIVRVLPKRYLKSVKGLLTSAGLKLEPERWIGFFFLFSVVLSLGVFFDGLLFNIDTYLMTAISVFAAVGINVTSYVILLLVVDKRVKFIEHMLPSALTLMASNIKSGMIPSQAMLVSARNEFGPLKDEMRIASNEIISGKSFDEALTGMSKRINSDILSRTSSLIIEGSRAGGEIAKLLEGIAEDIKHTELVKSEIRASVMMYIIFIFIAAGVAAPMLYAVSIFLVSMITKFGVIEVPEMASTSGIPFLKLSIGTISSEFLTFFAFASIIITSFFGSLIIGLIERGEEKKELNIFQYFLF